MPRSLNPRVTPIPLSMSRPHGGCRPLPLFVCMIRAGIAGRQGVTHAPGSACRVSTLLLGPDLLPRAEEVPQQAATHVVVFWSGGQAGQTAGKLLLFMAAKTVCRCSTRPCGVVWPGCSWFAARFASHARAFVFPCWPFMLSPVPCMASPRHAGLLLLPAAWTCPVRVVQPSDEGWLGPVARKLASPSSMACCYGCCCCQLMPKAALQAEQRLAMPGTLITPHLAQMQVRADWGAGTTQGWHTVLAAAGG